MSLAARFPAYNGIPISGWLTQPLDVLLAPRRKKTDPLPLADPHAKREKDRYAHPIPSREVILDLLERADAPLAFQSIAEQLGLSDERDPAHRLNPVVPR